MTKAVDDDGMQDRAADYEGEGGERAANNNGIRPAGQRWDRPSFFSIFFTRHGGRPKSKQEFTLNHLQRPIAHCGPNQGGIDTSPSRILLRLSRDTLLSRIGQVTGSHPSWSSFQLYCNVSKQGRGNPVTLY